jgi:uncharacterized protein (TIGR02266 family)
MPDGFDNFAQKIAAKNETAPVCERIKHQCATCREFLPETYIEQNPFPQVPCPACGSPVSLDVLQAIVLPASEQRTAKRCPVALKVSSKSYDNFIDEYTKNVSRRGMFIKTRRPHQTHDVVDLFLHVPGLTEPVHIGGEILHVNILNASDSDEDAGIGVKFIDIDEKSRQALIAFIQSQESRT